MLVQAVKNIFKQATHIKFPLLQFSTKKLNTEVFSDLSYGQIANRKFVKALIIKPIHNHSRVSQRSLFHRKRVSPKIVSCYSQKKHKVLRRVNKVKRQFYSQILGQKIFSTVSTKALRTINKMGSFDTYILCTKPKDLDSKFGEYLRELMLRKINDPYFRIPYIIGTNRKPRIKKYQRHLYLQGLKKIKIPKEFKQNYRTLQKKFGKEVNQLNNQDYAKYQQLQKLKKTLGNELEPTHPLLLQLKQKMSGSILTEEQQKKFDEMAVQAEQKFVNDPRYGQANRKRVQKTKHEIEMLNIKYQQIKFKLQDVQK